MCMHFTLSLAQNCSEHYAQVADMHAARLDLRRGEALDAKSKALGFPMQN